MLIPVFVQPPSKPQRGRIVGTASDGLTAEEVAIQVGMPEDAFIGGRISKNRKHGRHWTLVGIGVQFLGPEQKTCPHCGGGL
jgi:hypothetical protein